MSCSENNMINLRDYQNELIQEIRNDIRQEKSRILTVSPTGTGKTIMFTYIAKNAAAKGNRVLILTHRMEILQQTLAKLFQFGVQSGQIISGGRITKDLVQVGMAQTVINRLEKMQKPDIIIVDEAHHSVSNTFKSIINYWQDTTILGFTATPERLDGSGLCEIYQSMIVGRQSNWHVESGNLAYPRMFHPAIEHDFKFHTKQGDYDKKEMEKAYSQKVIIGDVISHYRKHLDRQPAVCFCVSIEHCEIMANEFRQAGYVAVVVKGDMKREDREAAINGLSTGAVHIVCSCDVISEGVDVPTLAGAILLRKTQSLGLYLQWIGRALRPAEGKNHAIILDHAGNYKIHGHPLQEREWSLESVKRSQRKNEKPLETTSCPKCGGIFPGKPRICPECSFEFSINKNVADQQRKTPKQIEGELTEALHGVQNASDLVNFGKQIQSLDPKIRQKALLKKAYELSAGNDRESFKKVMQPLAASVGYRKGWTDYVWKNILKKNG